MHLAAAVAAEVENSAAGQVLLVGRSGQALAAAQAEAGTAGRTVAGQAVAADQVGRSAGV